MYSSPPATFIFIPGVNKKPYYSQDSRTWSTLPNSPGLRDLAASFRLVSWDWISDAAREAILGVLCDVNEMGLSGEFNELKWEDGVYFVSSVYELYELVESNVIEIEGHCVNQI